MLTDRAGKFIIQDGGHRVFSPKPLPPDPSLKYDEELHYLLSEADRKISRLDAIITVLPNPDLFIAVYVKKEALLSSQIEGTQASLDGVLEFEADMTPKEDINEIKNVVNYIKALNHGIEILKEHPLSLPLIKESHRILVEGVRGKDKQPGEFRNIQNLIGPPGVSLMEATFVPPPPESVMPNMEALEKFIQEKDDIPPLIKIALIHSQFETIHPFRDGNGRIGRLLITFYLCWKGILSKPLLYLSFYLKKNRAEYYNQLMGVRTKGTWEEWVKFFLKGVSENSEEACNTAREIIRLKENLIKRLYENRVASIYAVGLIDLIFDTPMVSVKDVVGRLKISTVAANSLVKKFEKVSILKEITGKERYKKYIFKDYVEIISRGTQLD